MTLEIHSGKSSRNALGQKTGHIASIEYEIRDERERLVERVVCHEQAARANIRRATARLFNLAPCITAIRLVK